MSMDLKSHYQRVMTGGSQMTENITWDDAITNGSYIKLVTDEAKTLTIKNWELKKVVKTFGKESEEQIEFIADCIKENDEEVNKLFTTTSNRLKKALRKILEGKNAETPVTITIMKVGEQFNTQYSVKEVKA